MAFDTHLLLSNFNLYFSVNSRVQSAIILPILIILSRICKHYTIEVSAKYYEHEPNTVTEKNEVTILWHMPIQTDRETRANRSHIVMKDKKGRNCQLLEISVPTERNTSIKRTEKLSKYKNLEIEIERL